MSEEKNILEEGKVVKAMDKLKKERIDISINPKKFLLEYSKDELEKIEKVSPEGLNEDEVKLLEQAKANLKSEIEKYSQAKLDAVLVPLKYRDLQTVKTGIYEAVYHAQKYNWDNEVKIRAMIREERTWTIYLALRKKEDISKQYYANLEEICGETEATIDELYGIYLENFILSNIERKNS